MHKDFTTTGYRSHYDMSDLFGTHYKPKRAEFMTLDECKARLRQLGITTIAQYQAAHKSGHLEGMPSGARKVYGVSWAEILDKRPIATGWHSLESCQSRVQRLGIESVDQYEAARHAGLLHGFPSNPRMVYNVTWSVVLGKKPNGKNWQSVEQCQAAVKRLRVTSIAGYRASHKAGLLDMFPVAPDQIYGCRWNVILGKRLIGAVWPPLRKLQQVVKQLGITTQRQYEAAHKTGLLGLFPGSPLQIYKVPWSTILGKKPFAKR